MKIHYSTEPCEAAAAALRDLIIGTASPVLVYLAGGSALNLLDQLKLSQADKVRTIFIMGDERVSGVGEINNYLQLCTHAQSRHEYNVIPTVPDQNESSIEFANRLHKKVLKILEPNTTTYSIFAVLGIGNDGHTASIFPGPEKWFSNTYTHDTIYVSVPAYGSTREADRVTLTPKYLHNAISSIIVYAAGEGKKSILESLKNDTRPLHEQPAQLLKSHRDATIFTDQLLR